MSHSFAVGAYDLWHDRAVFHFLTVPEDREKYLQQVAVAVRPSGFLIIGSFALDGPVKCSGLTVERYSVEKLLNQFKSRFTLITSRPELHHTPSGAIQSFNYVLMRRDS